MPAIIRITVPIAMAIAIALAVTLALLMARGIHVGAISPKMHYYE